MAKLAQLEKDSYYFPHFFNARNDRKILRARMELGIEAYAIFFMILEVLREQKGYKYPVSDIDLLAKDFDTSVQKLETVIYNYDLFKISGSGDFFSVNLFKYMEPYNETKKNSLIYGMKGNLVKYGHKTKEELDTANPNEIVSYAMEAGFKMPDVLSISPPDSEPETLPEVISFASPSQLKKEKKVNLNKLEERKEKVKKEKPFNPNDFIFKPETERPADKVKKLFDYWNKAVPQQAASSMAQTGIDRDKLNFALLCDIEEYKICVDHYAEAYDFNKSKVTSFISSLTPVFTARWFSNESVNICKEQSEFGKFKKDNDDGGVEYVGK